MGVVFSRLVHRGGDSLYDYFLSLFEARRRRMKLVKTHRSKLPKTVAEQREVCTQTGDKKLDDRQDIVVVTEMFNKTGHASNEYQNVPSPDINRSKHAGTRFVFPDTTPFEAGSSRSRYPNTIDGHNDGASVHFHSSRFQEVDCSSPMYKDDYRSRSVCSGFLDNLGSEVSRDTPSCHDIQIIENPDFARYGDAYRNLWSPRDKWTAEPRCRCVTSLSPVKEELEMDASCDNVISPDSAIGDVTCRRLNSASSLKETFPIFVDSPHDATRRGSGSYGKRQLYLSASSDSGIGERLRSWSTVSSSCSSGRLSASDVSDLSRRGSDSSSGSQAEDLDNQLRDGQNPETFSKNLEVFGGDFDHDDDAFHSEEETPRSAPVGSSRSLASTAQVSAEAPPASLSIRARRKVTFTQDLLPMSVSGTQPSLTPSRPSAASPSASPPVVPAATFPHPSTVSATPPSVHSVLLGGRQRPLLQRQDSSDSSSSSVCSSSSDSVVAVPLSPRSLDSPTLTSSFAFLDVPDRGFSERREGCDLVLVVEGQRFFVHSSVVAWQCHVLLDHLQDTGSREVLLLDRRADDVVTFLGLLYPFHDNHLNERNVEAMMDLALYLGCERVRRTCVTYLQGLAHFPQLCVHRHLVPGSDSFHHRHRSAASTDSSEDGDEGASAKTGHFLSERVRRPRTPLRATSICACAETMPERVLALLELAVRYEQEDVYNSFLDVAAKMSIEDLTVCSRYNHLSSAVREDILMARLLRLESVIRSLDVSKDHLVTCNRSRHANFRVRYSGQLCLKCTSRNTVRQALKAFCSGP